MPGFALECDHLSYNYQERQFDFSIAVPRGQLLVLSGKSGSGKSTFLSLVTGLLPPTGGCLRIEGESVLQQKPSERNLSILFQSHNLFPHLTVFQNIVLGISPKLKPTPEETQEIVRIMQEFEISALKDKRAGLLSGGEIQRVALSRCLIRKKNLLLLDEPFSSLDSPLRAKGHELLHQVARRRHLTVLLVTHFPEEVATFADATATLSEGRIYPT